MNLVYDGLDSISNAYLAFHQLTKKSIPSLSAPQTPATALSTSSITRFNYQRESDFENDEETQEAGTEYNIRKKLELEIESFALLFDKQTKFFKKFKSNSSFWLEFREKAPMLNQLYTILSNIPASSAYVERFFSICGIVKKQRASTMTDGLFVARCLLKTNIRILDELNITSNKKDEFDLI